MTVLDELTIQRMLAQYCQRCDDGDFPGVVALFTADADFDDGPLSAHGAAGLLEFFEKYQGRPDQRGKHLNLNAVVELTADGARVTSDFVFVVRKDGRLKPIIAGRYHDRFVQVDGAWRIAARHVTRLP